MKSLYEGILADIEDTLAKADDKVFIVMANERDSEFRKKFNISQWVEKPFKLNGTTLDISFDGSNSQTAIIDITDNKISDYVRIDTLDVHGACILYNKDIASDVCKTINASSITVYSDYIFDVELNVKKMSGSRILPKLSIQAVNPTVINSKLELDMSSSNSGRLMTIGIPTFKNVTSDTIHMMDCMSSKEIVFNSDKKIDIYADKRWANLFDFGYTLNYCTGKIYDDTTTSKVAIKSMKDIKKLVNAKDFYSRTYNEFPYKLKANVKLSDFIDISKFKALQRIAVYDNRVFIIFEKINGNWSGFRSAIKNVTDLLKTSWDNRLFNVNDIPVTSDGWRVIVQKA